MSGVEVAGLALGVIPIFVEIFKSYRRANAKFETIRKYHKAAKLYQLRFSCQEILFRKHCNYLLSSCVKDEKSLFELFNNPEDSRWREDDLDRQLRNVMGNDYSTCNDVVTIIRDTLQEITKDFMFLEKVSNAIQQNLLQSLCDGFRVGLKENRYNETIRQLQEWNARFIELTEPLYPVHNPHNCFSNSALVKTLPRNFCMIREASETLHFSLEDAWSCSNTSHEAHQAKLWLNAEVKNESVYLNMAISCRESGTHTALQPLESPIWLQVRSETTTSVPRIAKLTAPPPDPRPHTCADLGRDPKKPAASTKTNKLCAGIQRVKKRVQFSDDTVTEDGPSKRKPQGDSPSCSSTSVPPQECHSTLDLRRTQSFCGHLNSICSTSTDSGTSCLGFLETKDINSFKFVFYDAGRKARVERKTPSIKIECVPVSTTLSKLFPLQRLELAHKLASSVLQYHQTPWLTEDWSLRNLSFFEIDTHSEDASLTQQLQTLHLSTQFSRANAPTPTPALGSNSIGSTALLVSPEDISRDWYSIYGIQNMTLAKLGVALLEIGHGQIIGSFNLGGPHEVANARMLFRTKHTQLGPRYQRLVRRCLDCKFPATEMKDKELQTAFFSEVVCELQEMIDNWK